MSEAIRVDGLAEFSRSLKKLDKDLPKTLRVALNDAAQIVVDDTVPEVPKRQGRASASVKARSTRTAARVSAGGSKAPHYPWLDFGGSVGRNRSVKRQFRKRGRYLYMAYFKNRDSGEFTEALENALLDVARQAGVKVD
jgi:hypothetical protein